MVRYLMVVYLCAMDIYFACFNDCYIWYLICSNNAGFLLWSVPTMCSSSLICCNSVVFLLLFLMLFVLLNVVLDFTNCNIHSCFLFPTTTPKPADNYTAVYTGMGASIVSSIQSCIDSHIKPLIETINKQQQTITDHEGKNQCSNK